MYVIHKQIVISVKETLPLSAVLFAALLWAGGGACPRGPTPHDDMTLLELGLWDFRRLGQFLLSLHVEHHVSELFPQLLNLLYEKACLSVSSFFISDNLLHSENVSAKLKLGSAFHWCKGTMISTGTCISDICIINVFSNAKDQSVHLSEGTLIDIHFLSNFVTQATNTL